MPVKHTTKNVPSDNLPNLMPIFNVFIPRISRQRVHYTMRARGGAGVEGPGVLLRGSDGSKGEEGSGGRGKGKGVGEGAGVVMMVVVSR